MKAPDAVLLHKLTINQRKSNTANRHETVNNTMIVERL